MQRLENSTNSIIYTLYNSYFSSICNLESLDRIIIYCIVWSLIFIALYKYLLRFTLIGCNFFLFLYLMYNFTVFYTCRYIYFFIFLIIINCDMSHVLEINHLILSYLISYILYLIYIYIVDGLGASQRLCALLCLTHLCINSISRIKAHVFFII